jgi:hypothetical protein
MNRSSIGERTYGREIDICLRKVAAALADNDPARLDDLVVQLAALARQSRRDLYDRAAEQAEAETAQGDEPTELEDLFASLDRKYASEAKARERILAENGREIIMDAQAQAPSDVEVAGYLLRIALQLAEGQPRVHASWMEAAERLMHDLMMAGDSKMQPLHVAWALPRDLDAVLTVRCGRYWLDHEDRPLRRDVLDGLRTEVAAWRQSAHDESYMQILASLPKERQRAECLPAELRERYPQVERDLLGIVMERMYGGWGEVALPELLDEISDQLAVAWIRD